MIGGHIGGWPYGCQYIYVYDNVVSTFVACHHLHHLMVLSPQQLNSTAIHGCFGCLHHDIALINEENLRRLGPVDLVIARYPC